RLGQALRCRRGRCECHHHLRDLRVGELIRADLAKAAGRRALDCARRPHETLAFPRGGALLERMLSVLGLVVILGLAYAFSTDRKAIKLKTVLWGLGLQFTLAVFVLKVPAGHELFGWIGHKVERLLKFSYEGSKIVFGPLGEDQSKFGVIFA